MNSVGLGGVILRWGLGIWQSVALRYYDTLSPVAIFFLDKVYFIYKCVAVMKVQFDPDLYWGFEPRESHKLSTNVYALSVAGAYVPRPQAGRGLLGVKVLLNEFSSSFRRRKTGGKERNKPWTMTITNSIAANRRGKDESSYSLFSLHARLLGYFAFLAEIGSAKRQPLIVGFIQ